MLNIGQVRYEKRCHIQDFEGYDLRHELGHWVFFDVDGWMTCSAMVLSTVF